MKKTILAIALLLSAGSGWARCSMDLVAVDKLSHMPVEDARRLVARKGCELLFNGERHGAYGFWVQEPHGPNHSWPTGSIIAITSKNKEDVHGVPDEVPRIAIAVLNRCPSGHLYCTMSPAGPVANGALISMGVRGATAMSYVARSNKARAEAARYSDAHLAVATFGRPIQVCSTSGDMLFVPFDVPECGSPRM